MWWGVTAPRVRREAARCGSRALGSGAVRGAGVSTRLCGRCGRRWGWALGGGCDAFGARAG